MELESNSGRSAILWKSDLDPIITQHPFPSQSITCIKITLESTNPIHLVSVYMPTAGKDPLFIEILAELSSLFSNIYDSFPDSIIIIEVILIISARINHGSLSGPIFSPNMIYPKLSYLNQPTTTILVMVFLTVTSIVLS